MKIGCGSGGRGRGGKGNYNKGDKIMKQLPEVNASFENLYGILIAPIQSLLLLAGIELGVFNHLSHPRSSDAVAESLKSHPENTDWGPMDLDIGRRE